MKAAAENLTPIILELGGQNPTVLCPSMYSVYPNPVNERIRITSTKELKGDLDIWLFDLTGKQIAHLKRGKTEPKISYDTQTLPGGLYLLRLNMEDGAFYHKIVIRH